jgi:sterol 3beta-glucosyltransferase
MRISAITYGSEGECRPLVALCRGLVDAGHDITLFADASAAAYAAGNGFAYIPLPGDMLAAVVAAAATLSSARYGAAIVRIVAGLIREHAGAWLRTLVDGSRHADAVLAGGMATFVGLSAAEALRVPVLVTALQPVRPTREFPTPLMKPLRLPGWANRVTHHAALAAMRRYFSASHNAARRIGAGLAPRYPEWRGYSMLFGMSPTLVPKPRDWPDDFHVVGYWWSRHAPDWRPPRDLAEFLAAGEPPVYVGFGSMVLPERARLQKIVLDALDGRRALLARGWSEWNTVVPATVCVIGPTPHAWLFPRVAVAVHHGGAGTVHAAARAAAPSVVVPFMADQAFWGHRMHRLGVAARPVALPRLTAHRLRDAIRDASVPALSAAARTVAQAMAEEDGVARAIALVERIVPVAKPPH